ncbi:YIP1 family protein [Mesobacillus maritimus]|uniref:YIP1 family protein n=1 Tax=Mesobacillus maritimus TaxID=1643336 RepID=A0ABS7K3M4_9BACI|nr:YIP1 family protein [Mesobacillus maritimus]MBY0096862.1 YIP1 family protein [Mesobacillus maritimus]
MSEETIARKPSIFGIIWSPTEQFERIKERPKIWAPLGIVTLLFIVGMYLTSLGLEIELEGIPEADLALAKAAGTFTLILVGIISPIFGAFISTLIYLLISKIPGSGVTFKKLFSMNTHLMMISALSVLVNGVGIALFGGNAEIQFTSLGSLIEVEGALAGLFNSIEVFQIWGVILTAIGLHKVADFSKGLAWTVSIAFYVISVITAMVGAAASGMVGL